MKHLNKLSIQKFCFNPRVNGVFFNNSQVKHKWLKQYLTSENRFNITYILFSFYYHLFLSCSLVLSHRLNTGLIEDSALCLGVSECECSTPAPLSFSLVVFPQSREPVS